MKRRYFAISLLLIGCGEEAPTSSVASTSQAVSIGDQLAGESEAAPAYYGTVAYGANGSFLYRKIYGPYTCNPATFGGDPAFGIVKACYAANPIVPPPRAVDFLVNYPSTSTSWSKDIQGLAHSVDSWFIAQKGMLWKIPLTSDLGSVQSSDPNVMRLPIPSSGHPVSQGGNPTYNLDFDGYDHFGDPDVHSYTQGGASALFMPLQGVGLPPLIAVFDADQLTYVTLTTLPDVPGIDFAQSAGWVAARPGPGPRDTVTLWVNGIRTSDQTMVFVSFKFDEFHTLVSANGGWTFIQGSAIEKPIPPYSILTSPTVYSLLDQNDQFQAPDLYTMQGGDFNEDGTLLYTSNGYCDSSGKIHVFRVLDQYRSLGLRDESYNPDDPSFQGVANDSFVFQDNYGDKTCPSDVALWSAVFAFVTGQDIPALIGLAAGEKELDGKCKCSYGSEEAEGLDYFDTRGKALPNVPDSQLHVILGDNVATNVWLKHYAFDRDLALTGTAYQSSNYVDWSTASLAKDGNMDGNFYDGSVSHTSNGFTGSGGTDWPGQYWYVDLGAEYAVDDVIISNRTDCCADRLSHFNVLMYFDDVADWVVVSNHAQDENVITSIDIPTQHVKTRYVMIAKTDDTYLHLAEVQVMGH